ncbi:acetyl-CoA carboxylase biotin carboxylase subunit family protein [Streptomyces sp. NPDC090442]|uniref:ATP-grasp domain-containing protein n=1 Tax=Streptomyces sp. NPDC090442 TaxID=3365962 RepID=UPI0037FE3966
MATTDRRPVLIVIGAGNHDDHAHLLQQIATVHPVVLLDAEPPAWTWEYVAGLWALSMDDEESVLAAVRHLSADRGVAGVMTYLAEHVPMTAQLAEQFGLPGMGTSAAAALRDTAVTRQLLEHAGVPTLASYVAETEPSAVDFAGLLGHPVIVTPRGATAALVGALRATTPDEVRSAYRAAAVESYGHGPGVLIEECLAAPQISAQCVVRSPTDVRAVAITRTSLSAKHPTAQVTSLDMVVAAEDSLLSDPAILTVVQRAVEALEFGSGVARVTMCRAPGGPRVTEVQGHLADDLGPLLVHHALGVSLPAAAATLATGGNPSPEPSRDRAAAAQILYAAQDGTLSRLTRRGADWPWLARRAHGDAHVGDHVQAPPHPRHTDRLAWWVVTGRNSWVCATRLHLIAATVTVSITPTQPTITAADAR